MNSHRFAFATSVVPCLFFVPYLQAQAPSDAAHAADMIKKNDLSGAEGILIPLTGESSTDAAAFFQLGTLRFRQQRPDDAAAAFERATKLDGSKAEYFSQYAVALSTKMQGLPLMSQAMLAPKMKRAFEKSVELDPRHLPGLIGLVRFYSHAPEMAGGSVEKARELAGRVKTVNPFLGELELGQIAERNEEFDVALSLFESATKLQPNHAGVHVSAGRMLSRLGRKDEARSRLQRALELDPKREATAKALSDLDASRH